MNSNIEKTEKAFHLLHPLVESLYGGKDIPIQSLLHALAIHAVLIIKKSTPQQAALHTFLEVFKGAFAELKFDSEGYLTDDAAPYFPSKMRKPSDPKPN